MVARRAGLVLTAMLAVATSCRRDASAVRRPDAATPIAAASPDAASRSDPLADCKRTDAQFDDDGLRFAHSRYAGRNLVASVLVLEGPPDLLATMIDTAAQGFVVGLGSDGELQVLDQGETTVALHDRTVPATKMRVRHDERGDSVAVLADLREETIGYVMICMTPAATWPARCDGVHAALKARGDELRAAMR